MRPCGSTCEYSRVLLRAGRDYSICTVDLERTRVNTVHIPGPVGLEIIMLHFAASRLLPVLAAVGTSQRSTKTAAPGPAAVLVVRPGCAPHATGTAGARAAICGERWGRGFPIWLER